MKPALILAALMLAQPAAAETRQHGNIVFDVPQGWTVGGIDETGTLTLLSDLPADECKFCYVHIATGTASDARLDSFLFSQVLRFVDDDEVAERKVLSPPEVFEADGRTVATMGQSVDTSLQFLFAVKLPGRLEIMAFEGYAADEETATESIAVFQRDIAPMFEGARYVSAGADPLMPAPEPGPLAGTYWGLGTEWRMGFDLTMQLELDHRVLTFWPDGLFYDGSPPDGLLPLDAAALTAKGDMNWGSYRVQGQNLILSFASGDEETVAVVAHGLDDDGKLLTPVEPLPDGTMIAGEVSSTFSSGFMPGSGVTGSMAATSVLTYRGDGTWAVERWSGASANFESAGETTGGYSTGSENSDGGTYEVRDGLIILTGEDGEYARHLIFRGGGDIMIGESVLE